MKDAIAIGQSFSRTPALCNIPCRRQQDVAPAKCGSAKRDLYPKSAPVLGSTEPLEHDGFACRRPLQHGCGVLQRVRSTPADRSATSSSSSSSRIAEHLTHTLIDIKNCTGVGIIDHDGVVDGRKDGAEALLALAQVRLRSLSIRDIAEETDAPDGVLGAATRMWTLECSSVLEAKVAMDWHVRIIAEPKNLARKSSGSAICSSIVVRNASGSRRRATSGGIFHISRHLRLNDATPLRLSTSTRARFQRQERRPARFRSHSQAGCWPAVAFPRRACVAWYR